jgi:hypothetical protein
MSPAVEGAIGQALRTLMNNNGFGNTKLIGYEHNWDNAATYPVQLVSPEATLNAYRRLILFLLQRCLPMDLHSLECRLSP